MKNDEKTLQGRSNDDLTELLCLDVKLSTDEKRRAQIHLQQCSMCREKFQELEGVYTQLNSEVEKPVSNKVLDFAKELRADDTKYGLVVCEPMNSEKSDDTFSYKTKVLFTANGTGSTKDKKLTDFDPRSFPKDSIAIRAMTDRSCDNLLLYLWQDSDDGDFDGWELRLPGKSKPAIFNPAGMSKIPLMEIEDLGDKVIYFKEKHNKVPASENRFVSIIRSISSK